MRIRSISSLAIFMLIAGCSRPSPVPHRLSVEDIIDKVHCELRNAVWDAYHVPRNARLHAKSNTEWALWQKNWKAAISLQIQTGRNAGLDGTADFSAPIHRGKFSLGLIAGFDKKATDSNTFSFDVFMDDLGPTPPAKPQSTYNFNADRCTNLEAIEGGRRRLLAGNLGLTDWMQRAAGVYKTTGTVPTGHTYFVEFVITLNGSAKPGFSITSPTGETYAVTIKAGGKRVKTHKLTVTLGKVPGVTTDKNLVVLKDILTELRQERIRIILIRIRKRKNEITESINKMELPTKSAKTNRQKLLEDADPEIINDLQQIENIKNLPEINTTVRGDDSNIRQLQILDALSRANID